jgi:hypothetical protein
MHNSSALSLLALRAGHRVGIEPDASAAELRLPPGWRSFDTRFTPSAKSFSDPKMIQLGPNEP